MEQFFIISLFSVVFLPGCFRRRSFVMQSTGCKEEKKLIDQKKMPDPSKPITILVHGTRVAPPLMILVPGLARQITTPAGLHRAADIDFTYLFARIARALGASDPHNFPLENVYLFGWSGTLSFKARKKAAQHLYGYIKELRDNPTYKSTPITVITVSHGGNVSLNLGAVAEEKGDSSCAVDRLILLCSPIQDATEKYANSPFFKKVYHFYSSGEVVQIADPQALYDTKDMGCTPAEFFSHRIIAGANNNVIQAEIRHKRRTLCHIDFAMPHFVKRLAQVLAVFDDEQKRCQLPRNQEGAYILDLMGLKKSS